MKRIIVSSNDVRIPDPVAGEAVIVTRYGADHTRAVIVHPDDFEWLELIVDAYRERRRPFELDLTDDDLEAHATAEADESAWEGLEDALAQA